MKRHFKTGICTALAGALLLAGPASSFAAVTPFVFSSILRYYDADNAVTASQLFAVPMPMARGEKGDWKLTVSPAYDQVMADPIKLRGASLNVGYSRHLGGGWGVYAIGLSNYMRTLPTTETGTPNDRLIFDAFFFGLSGPAAYSGTLASGGSITTLAESFGPTYTFRRDRMPVTIFAGPVFSQSYARSLHNEYDFTGTESGSGNSYRLHGVVDRDLTVTWMGAVMGAVAEYEWGKHLLIVPHIYEVFLPVSTQNGTMTQRHVQYSNGAVTSDVTSVFTANNPIGTVYFPIPGVDIVYRDWSLGINLIEPFGGVLARTMAKDFLHGAWPFSFSLSKSFGRYAK